MNSLHKICTLALTASFFAACTENGNEQPVVTTRKITLTAMAEGTAAVQVRTAIDNSNNVVWCNGDRIGVFAGSSVNEPFTLQESTAGTSFGSFDGSVAGTPTSYIAYYPYSASGVSLSGGKLTLTLPAVQRYAGAGDLSNAPSIAVSDSQALRFKNLCGLLKFDLTGASNIAEVRFEGRGGEKVAGSATVATPYDSAPVLSMGADAATAVSLSFGNDGLQLSPTEPVTLYLALPPQIFSSGFTLTVTDTDGIELVRTTSKEFSVKRSVITNVGSFDFSDALNNLIDTSVFGLLDLDNTSLAAVKSAFDEGHYYSAAAELLAYYRARNAAKTVVNPDVVDAARLTISVDDQKIADDALEYKFFAATGYESYCYLIEGAIDWTYWPVNDNELRYQLHRHKWFVPMAKAYVLSGDERYVEAWKEHYADWIAKNPIPPVKLVYGNPTSYSDYVNERFAWRPLETAWRVLNYGEVFWYMLSSENFTPEWLCTFLVNYHKQVEHIIDNYSESSNHLITQAQSVTYAGSLFPEFDRSTDWLVSGSSVLNTQLDAQFLDDGMLAELDLSYHIAAIDNFYKAMLVASVNGRTDVFPTDFVTSMHKLTDVVKWQTFPNYSVPNMNDTRSSSYTKSVLKRNFNKYLNLFPDDRELEWLATEGARGTVPSELNKAFEASGYYTLKSGWTTQSTMMVLQNGPKPADNYHSQPHNGTFELYVNGRNFFPDSGVYKYSGDAQTNADRAWFRQTRVHNTLTRDEANLVNQAGQLCLLTTQGSGSTATDVLVTKNQNYGNVAHRRSVFFVERTFFVLLDEAIGSGSGNLELNFHLLPGTDSQVVLDLDQNGAHTAFSDGNNILVRSFGNAALTSTAFDGRYSNIIGEYSARKSYSVGMTKTAGVVARYITVILPVSSYSSAPNVSASFTKNYGSASATIDVTVGLKTYNLSYTY